MSKKPFVTLHPSPMSLSSSKKITGQLLYLVSGGRDKCLAMSVLSIDMAGKVLLEGKKYFSFTFDKQEQK